MSGPCSAPRSVPDQDPSGRGPRRGDAPAQASVRPLRDRSRGRSGQVPDRCLRLQSLQRPSALRPPDGDRQGLRRSRRARCGREGRRDARTQLPKQTLVLDPVHYLATLGHKPVRSTMRRCSATGAAGMLRRLPAPRWKTPRRDGRARRYVRVLQLLGEHPLTRARKATTHVQRALTSAEAVIQRTRSFATRGDDCARHRRRSSKCPARLRSRCRSPT